MSKLLIKPKKLSGGILVPPSKSMSHRALISAGLCDSGKISKIKNIIMSGDMKATISGIKNLGVKIDVIKRDSRYDVTVKRETENISFSNINCMESGSTLRFLIPVSMYYSNKTIFEGKGRLAERPLDTYYNIFDMKNIIYSNVDGRLPLTIEGKLESGNYTVDTTVSSQFLTGLLFVLPKLDGDSTIYVSDKIQSKSYIDLTLDVLKKFGIEIENTGYEVFRIKGNQHYKDIEYEVEGDYSQAAFFLVANELGCNININGLSDISKQGDRKIIDIISDIRYIKNTKSKLSDKEILDYALDASQIPDLVPILAVYFSLQNKLHTKIINAGRLRFKESDRLEAIASQLKILGADIIELEDGLEIHGKNVFEGGCEVSSISDHRIAMALAIAAVACKNSVELEGYEAVSKSYPEFFSDYKKLGGEIYELDLGK